MSRKSNNINIKTVTSLSLIIFLVFTILPVNAHAYLDPGSGSYVIQVLIAGLATVGLFVKTYWNQIVNFFTKKNKSPKRKGDEQ